MRSKHERLKNESPGHDNARSVVCSFRPKGNGSWCCFLILATTNGGYFIAFQLELSLSTDNCLRPISLQLAFISLYSIC